MLFQNMKIIKTICQALSYYWDSWFIQKESIFKHNEKMDSNIRSASMINWRILVLQAQAPIQIRDLKINVLFIRKLKKSQCLKTE